MSSSVAAGLVTFAGERAGFGEMVEINHGNGSRRAIATTKKLLVKQGDMVSKGQEVALMGSTGRSTGPHLHFEVLKNGAAGRSAALHRRGSLSLRRSRESRPLRGRRCARLETISRPSVYPYNTQFFQGLPRVWKLLTQIFGSRNQRLIKELSRTVAAVNALEAECRRSRMSNFRRRPGN